MFKLFLVVLGITMLSGCALGAATSATAGYSLQAKSADSLSSSARQEIINEAVRQMKAENNGGK